MYRELLAVWRDRSYSIISDIKSSGADIMFSCSTTVATGVALIRQLKENGMGSMPHMAIYYPAQPEFVSQIGNEADGLLWAPMLVDTENNEANAEFAAKIKEYCGDEMTFDHLDGYSGMMVVLKAMEAAGSLILKNSRRQCYRKMALTFRRDTLYLKKKIIRSCTVKAMCRSMQRRYRMPKAILFIRRLRRRQNISQFSKNGILLL